MYTLNYIINYDLSDTLSLLSRLFLYSKLPIDILIATLGAGYIAWFNNNNKKFSQQTKIFHNRQKILIAGKSFSG